VTRFQYDAADRLIRQTLPGDRVVGFAYNATGDLTGLTTPRGHLHEYRHTAVHRVSGYSPPDVNPGIDSTGHEYDLDHRLRFIRRPDEQDVELEYDDAGRLERVVQPRGESALAYDATYGHLSSIGSPDTVTVTYEHSGPLVTREAWSGTLATPVAGEVRHVYGARLMPVEQTVEWGAGSHTVDYAYDADGLLSQAGALTVPASGGRDAGNGLLLATDVGSVRVAHGYSHVGELQSIVAEYGATEVFRGVLELDSLGRVVTRTESRPGDSTDVMTEYEYSAAGRLRQVTRDGLVIGRYGYDANGNRDTTWLASGELVLAASDAQDRLTFAGTDTFTYTAAGELAMRYSGPDTTRYTYDPLGNLVEVRLPSGSVITYVIDGMNRRVGRRVDGVLDRQWLYQNSLNPVAELDGAGALLARYVYGTRSHVPDYVVKGGTTYRIVTDHLGSVRRVVDVASGSVAMALEYDAWGRVTASEGAGFVWLGYAGGITDDSTSLVRFGARDYEPRVGRWTAKDPIGFAGGSANQYEYVLNDPASLVDPEGKAIPLALIAAGATVGGIIGGSIYSVNAAVSGSSFTVGGLLGAIGSGAIAGGVGAAASAIGVVAGVGNGIGGTAAINAAAGLLGSAVSAALDPCQDWSLGYGASSAAFGFVGGAIGSRVGPTIGMSHPNQVGFPRTLPGVVPAALGGRAGSNAMNAIYRGGSVSTLVGMVGPMYVH